VKLSRLGRQQLKLQSTNPNEIIRLIVAGSNPAIQDRKIEWKIGNLPLVECDQELSKQVFANLISNAIKYSRLRPTAVIEIGQSIIDGEKVIFIRDDGAGFDMNYADKLFAGFKRLHRQGEFEGTGVRLAIVQRILLRHGGRIWADGEMDKGARFYFTLGTGNTSSESTRVEPS
jgi:light-regulated signal transduction histidine kinase (bacteriophytochrome)